MRLSVNILIDGTLRSLELGLLDGCLELILGRLHQRRVERATNLQRNGTLSTSSLQLLASLVDSLYVARDNQLTRVVVVSTNNNVALAVDASANLLNLLVRKTMMAAIVEGAASQAFCIAIARA